MLNLAITTIKSILLFLRGPDSEGEAEPAAKDRSDGRPAEQAHGHRGYRDKPGATRQHPLPAPARPSSRDTSAGTSLAGPCSRPACGPAPTGAPLVRSSASAAS